MNRYGTVVADAIKQYQATVGISATSTTTTGSKSARQRIERSATQVTPRTDESSQRATRHSRSTTPRGLYDSMELERHATTHDIGRLTQESFPVVAPRDTTDALDVLSDLFVGAKHAQSAAASRKDGPTATSLETKDSPTATNLDTNDSPSGTNLDAKDSPTRTMVTLEPDPTDATTLPRPSCLVTDQGQDIVICATTCRRADWPGNVRYDAAVAVHGATFRHLDPVAQRVVRAQLCDQFHFQYYRANQWHAMGLKAIRKKLRIDLAAVADDDARNGAGAAVEGVAAVKKRGAIGRTGHDSNTGESLAPLPRAKRNAVIARFEPDHLRSPKPKQAKTVLHTPVQSPSTPGANRTHNMQQVVDLATKRVVFCGFGRFFSEPGNAEYSTRVLAERLEFLTSHESQRTIMVESFMSHFDFYRETSKDVWKPADEQWARSKVRKALAETRNWQPAQGLPTPPSVPAPPSQLLHRFANGKSPYIEELAFHYFAGLETEQRENEPLPPPASVPQPPRDNDVTWTFDASTRVYLANFSKVKVVTDVHKRFLGELMERDDITVVCEGLLGGLDDEQAFLDSVGRSFRNDPHHKFRRFERREQNDTVSYHEVDGYVTMEVSDFLAYLRILKGDVETVSSFVVRDQNGTLETIESEDARNHVFYMIDVDMPKMLVRINEEYKRNFKIKEILPGGAWCMMNHLPKQTRPFMGPNCYITPGGGYTQVHQDGHGTVDSGHSNVSGFNEVVMLRRLPEWHKRNACRAVPSFQDCQGDTKAQNMLYRLPHDDGREDKPNWPTHDTIEAWQAKNYCPSVFILGPGQHVLINKGRLHAFRKLTIDALPDCDCHALLRQNLIQKENLKQSPLCISIAFDWMFAGITAEGINREATSTLECTALCRDNKCKSLAIPETTILKLASLLPTNVDESERDEFVFHKADMMDSEFRPKWKDIARGILPSLRHIVQCEQKAASGHSGCQHRTHGAPDSVLDSTRTAIDPFGNDYFCKLCDHELSNTYFHCEGCETLLSRDFNICSQCFGEKKYLDNLLHDGGTHLHPNRDHVGKPRACRCGVTTPASRCHECSKCQTCCACTCHTVFSKRCRFFSSKDLKDILQHTAALVGSDEVEYALETKYRLDRVAMVAHDSAGDELPPAAETLSTDESPLEPVIDLLPCDESNTDMVESEVSSPESMTSLPLDRPSRRTTRTKRYGYNDSYDDSPKKSQYHAHFNAPPPVPLSTQQRAIFDVCVSSPNTRSSVPIAEENWNDANLVPSLKGL